MLYGAFGPSATSIGAMTRASTSSVAASQGAEPGKGQSESPSPHASTIPRPRRDGRREIPKPGRGVLARVCRRA